MRDDNLVHVGRTRVILHQLRRFGVTDADVAEELGLKKLNLPAARGCVRYIPRDLAEKIAAAATLIRKSLEEEWCGACGRRHDRPARLERLRTILRRGSREAIEIRALMECAYSPDEAGARMAVRDLTAIGAHYAPPLGHGSGVWTLNKGAQPEPALRGHGVAA